MLRYVSWHSYLFFKRYAGLIFALCLLNLYVEMTGDIICPDPDAPDITFPQIFVERTLAVIKPDALHKSQEIEDIILNSGFTITQVNSTW